MTMTDPEETPAPTLAELAAQAPGPLAAAAQRVQNEQEADAIAGFAA
jgi:hypothetical protein